MLTDMLVQLYTIGNPGHNPFEDIFKLPCIPETKQPTQTKNSTDPAISRYTNLVENFLSDSEKAQEQVYLTFKPYECRGRNDQVIEKPSIQNTCPQNYFSELIQVLEAEPLINKIRRIIPLETQQKLKQKKKDDFAKSRHWHPHAYNVSEAMFKMAKNSLKTIEDFRGKCSLNALLRIATPEQALDALVGIDNDALPQSITCLFSQNERQGRRDYMEDVSFFTQSEDGILAGVFDGHSQDKRTGLEVAQFVRDKFQNHFDKILTEHEGNVHATFEQLFFEIESELIEKYWEKYREAGTTAIVTYIDRKSKLMYVATIGDSEATIYRNIDGVMKAIPASRVLNWSSRSEARRAADFHNEKRILECWVNRANPKDLRSWGKHGLNVSRTLGDFNHFGNADYPLISSEPILTVFPLEDEDFVILASDGLEDYIEKDAVAAFLQKTSEFEYIAKKLTGYAYMDGDSRDNITVVAIKILEEKPEI